MVVMISTIPLPRGMSWAEETAPTPDPARAAEPAATPGPTEAEKPVTGAAPTETPTLEATPAEKPAAEEAPAPARESVPGPGPTLAGNGEQPTADSLGLDALKNMGLEELLNLTIVSAAKEEQTLEEASAIVSVVTREEIQRRSYRSIAEAVSSIPGLYINSDYVFQDIGVRGISGELRGASRLIKVMINGQPVSFRSDTIHLVGPEFIPMDAIERIEVIRGPGSTLYGANAFLGVINVVTSPGADVDGILLRLGTNVFNGHPGYDTAISAGKKIGPLDLLVAMQRSRTDRSGLEVPCTTYPGGCEEQQRKSYAPEIFGRESFDDLEQPLSALVVARLDLGAQQENEMGRFGRLGLLFNYQELDSRASFADFATLQYDEYHDLEGNPRGGVPGSGNRIGLYNATLRGQYELSLLEERLAVTAAAVYTKGGIGDREQLRDAWSAIGEKERSRYGFSGMDLLAEVRYNLLKDWLQLPLGSSGGMHAINNLNLLLAADYTEDSVTYVENKFEVPPLYRKSGLTNLGAMGQLTARLLDRRLGLTLGARYDSYHGARLSDKTMDRLDSGQLQGSGDIELCDGRICYDSFNYRVGLTSSLLQHLGRFGEAKHILDNLYMKAFLGTAFKAPAPLFLYHDDSLGSRPINPNIGLRPETVRSIEVQLGAQLFDRRLEGSVVFFDNLLKDKVAFQLETVGVVARNAKDDVQSRGVEGSLRWRFGLLDAQASLGYQHSVRLFKEEGVVNIPETFAFPDLTARASVAYDLKWIFTTAELEAEYVGTRVGHPMNKRGADSKAQKYELSPYTLLHLNLVSHDLKLVGDKPTTIALTVRNLLDEGYAYPGFQPYYGIDIPGEPRYFLLTLHQSI